MPMHRLTLPLLQAPKALRAHQYKLRATRTATLALIPFLRMAGAARPTTPNTSVNTTQAGAPVGKQFSSNDQWKMVCQATYSQSQALWLF